MRLRSYQSSDCPELAELFYNTIHAVNARDYTREQLDAWATGQVDLERWDRELREHHTVVAEEGGILVGFGDMDRSGRHRALRRTGTPCRGRRRHSFYHPRLHHRPALL